MGTGETGWFCFCLPCSDSPWWYRSDISELISTPKDSVHIPVNWTPIRAATLDSGTKEQDASSRSGGNLGCDYTGWVWRDCGAQRANLCYWHKPCPQMTRGKFHPRIKWHGKGVDGDGHKVTFCNNIDLMSHQQVCWENKTSGNNGMSL